MPFEHPPHEPLTAYYDKNARGAFLRRLFDATADDYDRLEALLSLGSGRAWRRAAIRRLGLGPGARVLDLASGTGVLAAAAARAVGPRGTVIALDLSGGMLRRAARQDGVVAVQASVDRVPFAGSTFDLLTMGYALRHVASLSDTFAEWVRVLRPGGRVLLLEIGRPSGRVGHALARLYLGRLVPAVSSWLRGADAAKLMRYYWETIDGCVPPSVIVAALRHAGLPDATCTSSMGIMHTYSGQKPFRRGVA